MIKILFVCHGNICRSPMAEFILKKMVEERGLSSQFEISSAATSREEIIAGVGNPVYPPAKAQLRKHGIECGNKRATQLKKSDYDYYDYLIGMDAMNIRNMQRITGHTGGKISMLLSFTGSTASISDPWHSGDFINAYKEIKRGCEALLEKIL